MKLRELADQLNRPLGEVISALTQNGFKGIYKNNHEVPEEAVRVVAEVLTNPKPVANALPSANTSPQSEAPLQQQQEVTAPTDEALTQLKDRVETGFNAIGEARQHISQNSYQQEVDDQAVAGVITALAGQASYNEAYLKTLGLLYGRGMHEQNKTISAVLDAITKPDFFGQQSPAESYFKLSQVSSNNSTLRKAEELVGELAPKNN